MQPWQHSYDSDFLSLKTINTDIYPHVKRFGCAVNTNFTPTCIVLLNLFFCLSTPSNTVGLLQVVKRNTQFIFGRAYVYFQRGSMHLDYSHSRFWCFVCRPVRPAVLTASPRLPVAHLQEREQRKPLRILRGVQIFSLLTSCFLLPYGIHHRADSPDHTAGTARNIFLNVLCLHVGGRK